MQFIEIEVYIMKTLRQIYRELMKDYHYVQKHQFLDYCYAYKDGECKKFNSYSEAQKFSNNIECFYDEERYKEAVEKNNQIRYNANQELKRLIKERLGIASNDKLDNALFELAFELGQREFNNDCEFFDSCSYDNKDNLFSAIDLYYDFIKKHLSKDKLHSILKDS